MFVHITVLSGEKFLNRQVDASIYLLIHCCLYKFAYEIACTFENLLKLLAQKRG